LFNLSLAAWILEGFMSGVPNELGEPAFVGGCSFPRFFTRIHDGFQIGIDAAKTRFVPELVRIGDRASCAFPGICL